MEKEKVSFENSSWQSLEGEETGEEGSNLQENPSPSKTANDGSADERNEILASQEQEGIDSNAVCAFVEEEDFGNGGRRQTLYWRNSNALEDSGGNERREARRISTPDTGTDEKNGTSKVYWPFPEQDGCGRGNDRAHTQAHHIKTSGQRHALDRNIKVVGDICESCGNDGCHAASNHAVEAQG